MSRVDDGRSSTQQKSVYSHRNRQVYIPDGYLAVGLIIGVHGLRGETKVELHTDYPERFAPNTVILLGTDLVEMEIEGARPHKTHMLLRLAGINRREDAEALRGEWIFINQDDANELDEDTYWIHDLVGLRVRTVNGHLIGAVADVLQTGANDVYIVRTEAPFNRGRDLLLPAIADVVKQVDILAGEMIVDLPPGLVEESPQ